MLYDTILYNIIDHSIANQYLLTVFFFIVKSFLNVSKYLFIY